MLTAQEIDLIINDLSDTFSLLQRLPDVIERLSESPLTFAQVKILAVTMNKCFEDVDHWMFTGRGAQRVDFVKLGIVAHHLNKLIQDADASPELPFPTVVSALTKITDQEDPGREIRNILYYLACLLLPAGMHSRDVLLAKGCDTTDIEKYQQSISKLEDVATKTMITESADIFVRGLVIAMIRVFLLQLRARVPMRIIAVGMQRRRDLEATREENAEELKRIAEGHAKQIVLHLASNTTEALYPVNESAEFVDTKAMQQSVAKMTAVLQQRIMPNSMKQYFNQLFNRTIIASEQERFNKEQAKWVSLNTCEIKLFAEDGVEEFTQFQAEIAGRAKSVFQKVAFFADLLTGDDTVYFGAPSTHLEFAYRQLIAVNDVDFQKHFHDIFPSMPIVMLHDAQRTRSQIKEWLAVLIPLRQAVEKDIATSRYSQQYFHREMYFYFGLYVFHLMKEMLDVRNDRELSEEEVYTIIDNEYAMPLTRDVEPQLYFILLGLRWTVKTVQIAEVGTDYRADVSTYTYPFVGVREEVPNRFDLDATYDILFTEAEKERILAAINVQDQQSTTIEAATVLAELERSDTSSSSAADENVNALISDIAVFTLNGERINDVSKEDVVNGLVSGMLGSAATTMNTIQPLVTNINDRSTTLRISSALTSAPVRESPATSSVNEKDLTDEVDFDADSENWATQDSMLSRQSNDGLQRNMAQRGRRR